NGVALTARDATSGKHRSTQWYGNRKAPRCALGEPDHSPLLAAKSACASRCRTVAAWLFTLLPDALSQFLDRALDFVQDVELDVAVLDLSHGVFDLADGHAAEEGFPHGGEGLTFELLGKAPLALGALGRDAKMLLPHLQHRQPVEYLLEPFADVVLGRLFPNGFHEPVDEFATPVVVFLVDELLHFLRGRRTSQEVQIEAAERGGVEGLRVTGARGRRLLVPLGAELVNGQ